MAGQVKGITIEFRGETTSLDRALKKVNQETKDIDKELKQVNTDLKFNPKSIELWRQKQNLLTQKVNETKDKLSLLKKQQDQMDADGVDKNSREYQKLRREIIETESKLKTFNGQLRETKGASLKALGDQFQKVGKKMQDAGEKLTKYVTGPIAGLGTASVVAFNDVTEGLNEVTKKTGATGDELQAMQESARNLAKTIPTDFQTAGSAIGEVNTRFGETGDELEALAGQYIKFSQINGTDVVGSIDSTQKALSAFNLTAEDAPSLLDTLTRASQNSGVSVDTLTSGLVQNSTAFQELGLDIDQSVNLMSQLEKSGANSETVMQGLRKALKNAAENGVPLDEALSNLQDTILNGTDSMDGLTASYDLFGKSGDQIFGAVKNGTLDFQALAGESSNSAGALDEVFTNTLTPASQFQTMLNSLKDIGFQLGTTMMTYIVPAMQKINEKIQELATWWGSLSPETQQMIVAALGIAAVIGPLLIIIGKLATAIGAIISLVGTIGPAIGGALAAAGPVIAVIAGIIAVGVLLYKNWDTIKAKAQELWTALKAKFEAIKTSITTTWDNIKTKAVDTFNAIKDAITHPIETARDVIEKVVKKIKSFFDFKVKLPHIDLPYFTIDPPGWKLGDLLKGKIPKLGIGWHAEGGIFTRPTLLASANGGLHGVGEAGAEAILPLNKLWEKLDNIAYGNGVTINVYGGATSDPQAIALEVERRLVKLQKQRSQAWT